MVYRLSETLKNKIVSVVSLLLFSTVFSVTCVSANDDTLNKMFKIVQSNSQVPHIYQDLINPLIPSEAIHAGSFWKQCINYAAAGATAALVISYACPTALPFLVLGWKTKAAATLAAGLTSALMPYEISNQRRNHIVVYNYKHDDTNLNVAESPRYILTALKDYCLKPMFYTALGISALLAISMANKHKVSLY